MDDEEVARRQEQTFQPDPSGTRLIPVGEEHHHDKKPVLKKVKDNVKKIKDTLNIKKHGHDDENDRDDDHDTSEEETEEGCEEEDEENIQDPEVHGAPMYDTPAAQEFTAGEERKEPQQKPNLGSINPTFQEDPAAPKTETLVTSDQNRATQPPTTRGGEEIKTSPVIESFGTMTISDQPHVQKEEEVKQSTPPTGTHDQFSPTAAPAPEDDKLQGSEEPKGPSYTEKLSATAAAAKSAAVSAAAGSTEYGKKIASTVYEEVAEAGTAVKEKVQQKTSGTTEPHSGDPTATQHKGMGVSMREYLAEKLRPGEEDKALSEVISEAFHKRKDETEQGPEVTGSGARGEGVRVVDKIRGAVTSLVGGGGGSRASPVSESTQTKGEGEQKETQQEAGGQKQEEQNLE